MKKLTAIALVCVLLLSLTACGEKKDVPELLHPMETVNAVYKVQKKNLEVRKTTGGYVVPECVDMKFDFDSTVHDVNVVSGDHVTKGQLLFELNSGLEDEIRRLEISLEREQAEFEYDLEKFNQQVKDMKKVASMMGSGYDGKLMKLQIQEMQVQFNKSHSGLEKKINKEKEELAEKQKQLEESSVYAPCSGTVVYINIAEDGDSIDENKTFLTIAKDDSYRLACQYISETDLRYYNKVTAQIGDTEYEVTPVLYTEEELYNLERTGNSFDSYFTASLPDTVKAGEYVLFSFYQMTSQPVLSVPTVALTKTGKTYTVTVMQDGRLVTKDVTIGDSSLNETVITGGLEEGETVYVAKDLARYGVTYTTAKAEKAEISEYVLLSGANRVAQKSEQVFNEVPGEIVEFCVTSMFNVLVKKGDPIFVVKSSVSRSSLEQAKQDLRKFENEFDLEKQKMEEQIEDLEKRMKKMSKKDLEYSLAELDLKDLKKSLAEKIEEAEEQIEKLSTRISNYEQWDGQNVTVYAENDGVISSLTRYKVGDNLNEGEYLFDLYDLNSYCICMERFSEDYTIRYGQEVTFETVVDGETREFSAKIISAPNVRPLDASDRNKVYIALDNPDDYSKIGETGIVGFTEFGLTDCMVIDELLLGHDAKKEEESSKTTTQTNSGTPGGFNWYGEEQTETTVEIESNQLDSEKHEKQKGAAYVWVYDDSGCAVKRYVRVMKQLDGRCWIVDGLSYEDTILFH
ncbi:MAG: biotin/lipoyl-binding protein [Lachnospiraceae bacterium]|nr:biotin/lipoyl-binding protein [Lachnospiraceae bacterium]